jgi:hypothetical protein
MTDGEGWECQGLVLIGAVGVSYTTSFCTYSFPFDIDLCCQFFLRFLSITKVVFLGHENTVNERKPLSLLR